MKYSIVMGSDQDEQRKRIRVLYEESGPSTKKYLLILALLVVVLAGTASLPSFVERINTSTGRDSVAPPVDSGPVPVGNIELEAPAMPATSANIDAEETPPVLPSDAEQSKITKQTLAAAEPPQFTLPTNPLSGVPPEEPKYRGYIIEFKNPPRIEEQGSRELDMKYKAVLDDEHKNAKNDIAARLDREINAKYEYELAFNGIALDISDTEANIIGQSPFVKQVYPDYEVKAMLNESAPLIGANRVWALNSSDGVRCCGTSLTGKGVKIAVLDTGVNYLHRDLGGCIGFGCKVFLGWNFVNNTDNTMDDNGHGTHVAAIAAGRGPYDLTGVAPDANIIPYKVLDRNGIGYQSWIMGGIERAINSSSQKKNAVNIISMSLGGYGNPDDPLSVAVDNAVNAGIVVVVAAGNSYNYLTITSPGTARNAITVGATDKTDTIANYTSRGPVLWGDRLILKPDVVAPGSGICAANFDYSWSPFNCADLGDQNHILKSGTSMATPHVAGLAALIKQAHPDWTPGDIKSAIKMGAKNLNYDIFSQGFGRIDAYNAVFTKKLPIAVLNNLGIVNGSVQIKGSANGTGFRRYTLEIGKAVNRSGWILLAFSVYPKINATLVNLDTTRFADDLYILRLTTYSVDSGVPVKNVDEQPVVIANKKLFRCNSWADCNVFSKISYSSISLMNNMATEHGVSRILINAWNITFDGNAKIIESPYDVIYDQTLRGIAVQSSSGVKIKNFNLRGKNIGIEMINDNDISIENSSLFSTGIGGMALMFYYTNKLTLHNVSIYNYSVPIFMSLPDYTGHTIDTSNTIDGKPVYYFENLSNSVLKDLDSGGVILLNSRNVSVVNSSIGGEGVYILGGSGIDISRNNITDARLASVLTRYSENITIAQNRIVNNKTLMYNLYGIGVSYGTKNASIVDNKIESHEKYWLSYSFASIVVEQPPIITSDKERTGGIQIAHNDINLTTTRAIWITDVDNLTIFENKILGYTPLAYDMMFFFVNTHNNIIQNNIFLYNHTSGYPVYTNMPVELSYANRGNFWGRTVPPYFCKYGNQSANCIYHWDSNRPDVVDSCPYNQSYPNGQWPASPVC